MKAVQQGRRSGPRVISVPGTIGRNAEVEAVTGIRIDHEFERGLARLRRRLQCARRLCETAVEIAILLAGEQQHLIGDAGLLKRVGKRIWEAEFFADYGSFKSGNYLE